jgi:multimeric flavodoxin WrbA
MKKVVAFNGSPRKSGNTATVVEEILRGAKQAGADIKTYNLNDMTSGPVRAVFPAGRWLPAH